MNITEADFERMSWWQRQQYLKRIRAEIRATYDDKPEPDAFDEVAAVVPIDTPRNPGRKTKKKAKRGQRPGRRIRVYKIGPQLWEMTDGLNTVRTSNAATAWSLIRRLGAGR